MSIIIHNVSLHKPNEQHIPMLQEVTTTFQDGCLTLLIGQTGSGKSTFLKSIAGLYELTEGQIYYDDHPLWLKNKVNPMVNHKVGYVFQNPEDQLFATSVRKEFEYSLKPYGLKKNDISQRAKASLEELGLEQQLLEESPFMLSGGQKRRIALATSLAAQPEWILLDEPTSGLDPRGTEQLAKLLLRYKHKAKGGMIIATHDLDTFLPLADQVIIMSEGRLKAQLTPLELLNHPELLLEARIGIPCQLQLALHLASHGMDWPRKFLTPEELAERIVSQARSPILSTVQRDYKQQVSRAGLEELEDRESARTRVLNTQSSGTEEKSSLIRKLDPRGKWLFYLLVSIGILWQSTWTGIFVASMLTALLILITKAHFGNMLRMSKPFLYFMALTVFVSGLQIQLETDTWSIEGLSFNEEKALYTGRQLSKFFLVMLCGYLLPLTTSHLLMKRGIDQGLSFLKVFRFPIEALALGASLMFRFVPIIMQEVERFSLIARARGKAYVKAGRVRIRDIKAMSIPLLISILRLAEELSIALEARGYKQMGQKRTSSIELRMQKADYMTLGIGVLIALVLVFLNQFIT